VVRQRALSFAANVKSVGNDFLSHTID